MELKLALPQADDLNKSPASMLKLAQSVIIDSPAMYDAAADDLKKIKSKLKALDEQRKAITNPLDTAKKAVMDLFRKPVELLEQAESMLKTSMLTYQREEQRKADEQQRLLDAEAKKERERMESQAQLMNAEAQKQAASGNVLAAEQAQAEASSMQTIAAVITAPSVQSIAPRVSGIAMTQTWKARITDKAALIKHIAEHPECLDWIDIKMTPLNQLAKALKTNMNIPGVQAYPEDGLSARAA